MTIQESFQARKRRRARRYLCSHLQPVLRVMLQMGHSVFATGLDRRESLLNHDPAGPDRLIRRVHVRLKTGPSIKDLRQRRSVPPGVVYGVNRDERAGPPGRSLQCTQCLHFLDWPLPGERW